MPNLDTTLLVSRPPASKWRRRARWLFPLFAVSALAASPFVLAATHAPAATHAQIAPADAPSGAPRVAKSETSAYDLWVVACDIFTDPARARKCLARLKVVRKNAQRPIVILALGANAKGEMRFDVEIPTATSIPEGVTIKLDGSDGIKLPIMLCEPSSCVASLPLDPDLGAALARASAAQVSWASLSAGVVSVDFGVKGAKEALTALFK